MSEGFSDGGLGSLAQSARTKQLKSARGILLFVGILTILVNGGMIIFAESIVDAQMEPELQELRSQNKVINPVKLKEIRDGAVRATRFVDGIAVVLGFVFVACGMLVYKYPVAATVIALVLYVGCAAGYGVLDPRTLAAGWWMKIIIVVCLFKAVQAALAYESERKSAAAGGVLSDLPAAPA